MNVGYRKRIVFLLFLLLLGRFWYCQTFELTGPEAYTWMKGRLPDWGYWDQGPLVPWLSWLGTQLYHQSELGVRWATANIYVFVGFGLFYLGRSWFSPRIGFYSFLLYLALPLFSWQMLLLSEATVSVGLMALALLAFRYILLRDSLESWLLGALVVAVATTVDWWNLLWAVGFLLFYGQDRQQTSRFFSTKSVCFLVLSLLGLVPFLAYHWHLSALTPNAPQTWPMLQAHQYRDPHLGFLGFCRILVVWMGPMGLLAIISARMIFLRRVPLSRGAMLLLCLPLPGLVLQVVLSSFGLADEDVLAALWLPWLPIMAVIASQLWDAAPIWRSTLPGLLIASLVVTLSGFWPPTAKCWGPDDAPQAQHHRMENLSAEVSRAQNETGAAFLLTDSPQDASLLSFYLPLHPFVHLTQRQGFHSQYDLWSNYLEFQGASAIFLSRSSIVPPNEVIREFTEVKSLRDICLSGAPPWRLFACTGLTPGKP